MVQGSNPSRGKRFISSPECSDRFWIPPNVLEAPSIGVKWSGSEADQSPPSGAEVQNEWSWTSTHLIWHTMYRDHITYCTKIRVKIFIHVQCVNMNVSIIKLLHTRCSQNKNVNCWIYSFVNSNYNTVRHIHIPAAHLLKQLCLCAWNNSRTYWWIMITFDTRKLYETCHSRPFLFKWGNLKTTTHEPNPGGSKIIRTWPDQPWVPYSLLYSGWEVIPGGKLAGAWQWPPTPNWHRG